MPVFYSQNSDIHPKHILFPCEHDNVPITTIKELAKIDYILPFKGEYKEQVCAWINDGLTKVTFLGLGTEKESTKISGVVRSTIHHYKNKEAQTIVVLTDHLDEKTRCEVAIGCQLGLINHGIYKTNGQKIVEPNIYMPGDYDFKQADNIATSIIYAMDLVNQPSNIKTPEYLAQAALASAKKYQYSATIFDEPQLQDMKMDALLAVGQGSNNPSRLIVVEYKPEGNVSQYPTLGLVGKGITFDTGGISIKPSANMGYMKSDMGGAAAVLGAIELIAKEKLNIHVVGVIPSAENSVDAKSYKPGDVISSYSGKSIEVIDTDAEGRLVLADGLSYIISQYKPAMLVDLATLTGNCIAALGYQAAGMFSHNEELAHMLSTAGYNTGERVWRLPIWEEYAADMQSDIADIKNLSSKPVAGAITAAKFLEFFTNEHPKWAHLDIAGVAFTDSEFAKMRTSSGYGVRLLYALAKQLST